MGIVNIKPGAKVIITIIYEQNSTVLQIKFITNTAVTINYCSAFTPEANACFDHLANAGEYETHPGPH